MATIPLLSLKHLQIVAKSNTILHNQMLRACYSPYMRNGGVDVTESKVLRNQRLLFDEMRERILRKSEANRKISGKLDVVDKFHEHFREEIRRSKDEGF